LTLRDLDDEFGLQRLLCLSGLGLRQHTADRVLRGALRNHPDRDAGPVQRGKYPLGSSRNTQHAGTFDIDQRQIPDAGHALDRWCRRTRGIDSGAGQVGPVRAADVDRNAASEHRRHGLRMQHASTEIGQFEGFHVRQSRHALGLRHAARIG